MKIYQHLAIKYAFSDERLTIHYMWSQWTAVAVRCERCVCVCVSPVLTWKRWL